MQVFIDTSTGTWGLAEDIVFVDLPEHLENVLNDMSDSQIMQFGNDVGDAPVLSGF